MATKGFASVHRLLKEAVDRGHVPGVVALAADRNGVVVSEAAGYRSLDTRAPMTLDTVFWIASLTKAVTSVAALQLVEKGLVGLDDPLGPVLGVLSDLQVLEEFEADGAPKLRPARGAMTLRHLLTHTSGFGTDIWSPELTRYMEATGTPSILSNDPAALRAPLLFDPGARWCYGTSNDVIGELVTELTGEGLGAYFARNIFEPLGMTETGFGVRRDQLARIAIRHGRTVDGGLDPHAFEHPERVPFEFGGHGLFSTGPDYMRFLQALLAGGSLDGARILTERSVADMAVNQIGNLEVSPLPASHLAGIANRADILPGAAVKWGLGFLLNTERVPRRRAAQSLAWAGLANAYFWIDPASGVAGLILSQILPFADPHVLKLLEEFEIAVYDSMDAGVEAP